MPKIHQIRGDEIKIIYQEIQNFKKSIKNLNDKDIIAQCEKTLEDFSSKKSKHDTNLRQLLNSTIAGIKLMLVMKMNVTDIDFQSLKNLLLEAYQWKEYPILFNLIMQHLSRFFVKAKMFKIANVMHILTLDSYKILIENSGNEHIFKNLEHDSGSEFKLEQLSNELEFFELVFENSTDVKEFGLSISPTIEAREKVFLGILAEMGIVDIYLDIPNMICNFDDAQKLSKLMLEKLDSLKWILEDICEAAKPHAHSSLFLKMLNYKYLRGCVYFSLGQFQEEKDDRYEIVDISRNLWQKIRFRFFEPYSMDDMIQIPEVIEIFLNLIERNLNNFDVLLALKSFKIYTMDPATEDVGYHIQEMNVLLKNFIVEIHDNLIIMDTYPDHFSNKMKILPLHRIAKYYRFIILKNEINNKMNLASSKGYIRRFVNILKTDREAYDFFMQIAENPQDIKFIQNKNHSDCITWFTGCIDSGLYLRKFRV